MAATAAAEVTEAADKSSSSSSPKSTLLSIAVDQVKGLMSREKSYQVRDYLHVNTTPFH
jgi:hypothetical protein